MNYSDFNDDKLILDNNQLYTNYLEGSDINQSLLKTNNIVTNKDYRKFLINNATRIMKYNKTEAETNTSFCCNNYNDKQNNSPYLFEERHNNDQPNGYENSDMKERYIEQYNMNNELKIPVIKIEK